MSEMTEVNQSRPSLNGSNPLATEKEDFANGASSSIKTSIPMQEVSNAREEPVPAASHYLPSDDRSTAAAASAAVAGGAEVANSLPGGQEGSKSIIEGPGHESDVRKLNGTGLAGIEGQSNEVEEEEEEEEQQQQTGIKASEIQNEALPSTVSAPSSQSIHAPGSQNPFNESEEQSLEASRPSQADTELATPAGSIPSAPIHTEEQAEYQNLSPRPSVNSVAQEKENVLSPVKIDAKPLNQAVALSDAQQSKSIVSAIDEPVVSGETKVEDEPVPVLDHIGDGQKGVEVEPASIAAAPISKQEEKKEEEKEDVKMTEPSEAAHEVLSTQGIAAPAVVGLGAAGSSGSQGDEPPSKRQRKSVSLGIESGETSKPVLAGPDSTSMTQTQIKFCQNAVKALKGRPEAGPFLAPVDPIALNIPHYPNIIQEPMDLGTIDIRLALTAAAAKGGSKPTEKTKQAAKWNLDPIRDVYANVEAFEKDVRLVFGNCVRFNGPDHILSQNAKNLQSVFEKQLKTLPPATPAAPPTATTAATESESGTFETPVTPSSNGARRPSDVASRPKRDIHPPAPKDLPWIDRPQSAGGSATKKKKSKQLTAREAAYHEKVNKDQLRFVNKLIDDMHKPPLNQFAWVFHTKPSMDLDFAPSYYNLIKKPISFKEIKARLVHGEYDNVDETKADVELMLYNCFLYNEKGSDVWTMGMEVKKAWESRLAKMPQPPPLAAEEEEEEEEQEEDENEAQVQIIKDQIATLQAQLEGLTGNSKAAGAKMLASAKASLAAMPGKKAPKKRRPSESSGSVKKANSAKKPKTPSAGTSAAATSSNAPEPKKAKAKRPSEGSGGGGGGKKRDEDVRDVTYEQKEELAAKITQLPDDRLDGALKIIAEDKPPNAYEDEEIELDVDDLSPQTLYKLYKYVVRPKGKKAPSKVSASDGRKRGTGGVKRKNLDEGEEAARIARLQEQLQQFDNPESGASSVQGSAAAAQTGAHDDLVASESSSGEEDSDSESEYE